MMKLPRVAVWMCTALLAAIALIAAEFAFLGSGLHGTFVGLQVSARFSFLLFWPAYVGGALRTLLGKGVDVSLGRGREFGLAFASAHLVHLSLVLRLCYLGEPPPLGTFLFFGLATAFTYTLAILSIGSLQRHLWPNAWWLLRVVGLNFILYAFAKDFLRVPYNPGFTYLVGYLPFIALSFLGPILKLLAFVLKTARPMGGAAGKVPSAKPPT
jgi:hypothetical protein